jgi:glycine/D-amino acid oxidase-like deaminating enzyme
MQDLLDDVRLPLTTERQVVFWFEPKNKKELFLPPSLPIFAFELSDSSVFYGIPDFGDGLKAARHHQGEIVSPNRVNRTVTHKDELPVRKFLAKYVPFANGPILSYTTCMYTNAPDGHFIIDRHPRRESAIIVSACSGHGFKFSPVIGEIVLQLIKNGKTEHNISRFSIGRFSKASTRQ